MSKEVFPAPLDERNHDVLNRAQLLLAAAVFFEDVTSAIVEGAHQIANSLGLPQPQSDALWLRESELGGAATEAGQSEKWCRVVRRNAQNGAVSDEMQTDDAAKPSVFDEDATENVLRAARGETVFEPNETVFPLMEKAHVVGVLQMVNVGENDSSARQAQEGANRVLESFGEHAAAALSRARLFEQLENAKCEWEKTFDSMTDGVLVESLDGTILRANMVAARLFGLEIREIIGCTRGELHALLPEYRELHVLSNRRNEEMTRDVGSGEFRFGTPARIISETVFPLDLDACVRPRQRFFGRHELRQVRVLRDISERSRLEEQLMQSEKLAALGELISGFTHELNNPLTTVTGYAQLLQDDATLPANARRQIEHIYQDASRASRIVANLMSFARREETRRETVGINGVLRQATEMRAYQLQAENVQLQSEYADDLPDVVGEAQQLQQVFLHVLGNAQQALSQWRGGGTISVQTRAVSVGGENGVLVCIADNGPGIAPDHLRRLFDPFWTTKSAGEVTGLGMSLSLEIVSRHNGRIWAESTLGQGARFFIELPGAASSSRFETQNEATESESSTRNQTVFDEIAAGAQILVVDDEEPVILLISEVLGIDEHEITAAYNGGEALALLQERDFDLILSDVRMPAVGGPTFFEILQTVRPDLLPRVVFVTGDTMSRSTQEFLKKANRPILAKPFDPDRLRALVREQLNSRR